jgi:hypothetical protein
MHTQTPRQVLTFSFRRFLDVRHAGSAGEQVLMRKLLSDPRGCRAIASSQDLKAWVKWGPRMPREARTAAPALWEGYREWLQSRTAAVDAV